MKDFAFTKENFPQIEDFEIGISNMGNVLVRRYRMWRFRRVDGYVEYSLKFHFRNASWELEVRLTGEGPWGDWMESSKGPAIFIAMLSESALAGALSAAIEVQNNG